MYTIFLALFRRLHIVILRHRNRIGLILVGHTAKQVEEYLFDWLLYGSVVAASTFYYGPLYGSVIAFFIMAPLSALACLLYIRFYDWLKIDWLGLEVLKSLKEAEADDHWAGRLFRAIAHAGKVPAFFALSIYGDPFMVTVYFREGAHRYHGLSRRDWKIFWASVLVSNGYWTIRWTAIIALALYVWQHFLQRFFV